MLSPIKMVLAATLALDSASAATATASPVMGGWHSSDGSTYFSVCGAQSKDDPGRFYYNNTKDGNSTQGWTPFAKLARWANNTYTSHPWWQTGLFYYDIKFSGDGIEVVSNEKNATALGPANCTTPNIWQARRVE